jgi:hypothetical protein
VGRRRREMPQALARTAGGGRSGRAARRSGAATTATRATRTATSIPWPARVAALVFLLVFAVQASIAARRDSVTIDEFVHLPVGLYTLYTRDFSLDPINPPWPRMIAASALLFHPPAFAPKPGMAHWSMGYLFMQSNAAHYQELFARGRTMIILVATLLGFLVFVWASQLYGWPAGLAAVTMFAFSPAMLAHGHLVTLDMSGALGFTVTAYATWRMLERPRARTAIATGAAIGVATLLKLSGFVMAAVVVACVVVSAAAERGDRTRPSPARWLLLLSLAAITTLLVINAGYGFDGTMALLSSAKLAPDGKLAGLAASWPWLRLPLPRPFLEGLDMVLEVGKEKEPSYFLAGKLSSEGWWYYHLAAFALKTPIPLVAVSILAVGAWLVGKGRGRREYCVFFPVLLIFVSNSLFNSLQIGVRHVLPVYPLLFVGASPWIVAPLRLRRASIAGALGTVLVCVGALWLVGGTLRVAPRYLQYFNEIAGGAEGGHRWLIDSNIDWGQDLIRLREYIAREGLPGVYLAYFGRVDPRVYGIRFAPLERGRSHGVAVVSASFLMGRPYFWYLGGRMRWVPSGTYTWLQDLEPIARVGSMFVYRLE